MPPNALYYGDQVADLIRDRGRIEAQRASTRGATLASAFQAAPRALAGFVQARDAQRLAAQAEAERAEDRQWQGQQRKRTMADWSRQDAITDAARMVPLGPDGQPDYGQIATEVGLIDPMAAAPYRQLDAEKEARGKAFAKERAETIAKELGATTDQGSWDAALNRLAKKAIHVPEVARQFSAANRDAVKAEAMTYVQWLQTQTPEPVKTRPMTYTRQDGTTVEELVPDVVGTRRESTPAKPNVTFGQPEIAMVGTKRDYIVKGVRPDGTWAWYLPNSETPFTGRVQPLAETTPASARITPAQKAMAERTKLNELQTLEAEFRKRASGADEQGPMPAQELENRKLQIENAYRVSLGQDPLATLPEGWRGTTPRRAPWAPPMAGGRPSTRAPFGPSTATAAPTSQRPTAPVTAPSTPTVQRPMPSASTTRPNVSTCGSVPPETAPMLLPAGTSAGDTFVQDGRRFRVKSVTGQQVESEPVSAAPKVGDIIIDQGTRVEIIAIENGQVRVRER